MPARRSKGRLLHTVCTCASKSACGILSLVVRKSERMASVTKTVLVCLGERKRESLVLHLIMKKMLKLELGKVFCDVLSADKIRLVLQYKNEDWSGEFIDAMGSISDKSVLLCVKTEQAEVA